ECDSGRPRTVGVHERAVKRAKRASAASAAVVGGEPVCGHRRLQSAIQEGRERSVCTSVRSSERSERRRRVPPWWGGSPFAATDGCRVRFRKAANGRCARACGQASEASVGGECRRGGGGARLRPPT